MKTETSYFLKTILYEYMKWKQLQYLEETTEYTGRILCFCNWLQELNFVYFYSFLREAGFSDKVS